MSYWLSDCYLTISLTIEKKIEKNRMIRKISVDPAENVGNMRTVVKPNYLNRYFWENQNEEIYSDCVNGIGTYPYGIPSLFGG